MKRLFDALVNFDIWFQSPKKILLLQTQNLLIHSATRLVGTLLSGCVVMCWAQTTIDCTLHRIVAGVTINVLSARRIVRITTHCVSLAERLWNYRSRRRSREMVNWTGCRCTCCVAWRNIGHSKIANTWHTCLNVASIQNASCWVAQDVLVGTTNESCSWQVI